MERYYVYMLLRRGGATYFSTRKTKALVKQNSGLVPFVNKHTDKSVCGFDHGTKHRLS